MADFDPYLKWLGIRDSARPINHYRILGLETFENDRDVIATAADRQMTHVRSYQNGPNGELSQKLLSELAVARRCLLSPDEKRDYDQQLRQSQELKSVGDVGATGTATPSDSTEQFSFTPDVERPSSDLPTETSMQVESREDLRGRRNRRHQSQWILSLFAWVSGGLAAVAVAAWVISSGWLPVLREKLESFGTEEVSKIDPEPTPEPETIISPPIKTIPELTGAPERIEPRPSPDRDADPFGTQSGSANPFGVNTLSGQPNTAIPSSADIRKAKVLIETQYASQLASGFITLSQKKNLAQTLLADAEDAESGSAKQFALLSEASHLSTAAGDLRTAVTAIKRLADFFQIDYWKMVEDAVGDAADNATKQAEAEFKLTLDAMIEEAMDKKDFDAAIGLVRTAYSLAKKSGNEFLIKEYNLKRQQIREQASNATIP